VLDGGDHAPADQKSRADALPVAGVGLDADDARADSGDNIRKALWLGRHPLGHSGCGDRWRRGWSGRRAAACTQSNTHREDASPYRRTAEHSPTVRDQQQSGPSVFRPPVTNPEDVGSAALRDVKLAGMAYDSDSTVQREAEPLILAAVSQLVGQALSPKLVEFESGARVQVDGVDADESVFVEVFAHQGALKGGQQKKVSNDALKLITLGRSRPGARLIIAFADEAAAAYASKGTWVSQALATWGVEVVVVHPDQAIRDGISAAQVRQQMVNPEANPPADAEFD
jgi:hypothetical protein